MLELLCLNALCPAAVVSLHTSIGHKACDYGLSAGSVGLLSRLHAQPSASYPTVSQLQLHGNLLHYILLIAVRLATLQVVELGRNGNALVLLATRGHVSNKVVGTLLLTPFWVQCCNTTCVELL